MQKEIMELNERVSLLEKQRDDQVLTLVEILSNVSFFGKMKETNCEYARNGQCSLYFFDAETRNKIPLVNDCKIDGCKETLPHRHIELSNVTCSLCQEALIRKQKPSTRKKNQSTKVENKRV